MDDLEACTCPASFMKLPVLCLFKSTVLDVLYAYSVPGIFHMEKFSYSRALHDNDT